MRYSRAILAALLLIVTAHSAAAADPPTVESVLGAVVLLQSEVPADARTAMSLGRQRYGNGIVIEKQCRRWRSESKTVADGCGAEWLRLIGP